MSKSLPGRQVGTGILGTAKTKETKRKRHIPRHSYIKEMRYGEKDGLGTGWDATWFSERGSDMPRSIV